MSLNNEKGTAFIEAALVMPFMVFILMMTIDLGMMIQTKGEIEYVNHQIMRKFIMHTPRKSHAMKQAFNMNTRELGTGATLNDASNFIFGRAFELLHFHGYDRNNFLEYQVGDDYNPLNYVEFEIVDDPAKDYLYYKQTISVVYEPLIVPKSWLGNSAVSGTKVFYLQR